MLAPPALGMRQQSSIPISMIQTNLISLECDVIKNSATHPISTDTCHLSVRTRTIIFLGMPHALRAFSCAQSNMAMTTAGKRQRLEKGFYKTAENEERI